MYAPCFPTLSVAHCSRGSLQITSALSQSIGPQKNLLLSAADVCCCSILWLLKHFNFVHQFFFERQRILFASSNSGTNGCRNLLHNLLVGDVLILSHLRPKPTHRVPLNLNPQCGPDVYSSSMFKGSIHL